MGAVSIWELAANSGSSWMSQAPNLHFARQLLTVQNEKTDYQIIIIVEISICLLQNILLLWSESQGVSATWGSRGNCRLQDEN